MGDIKIGNSSVALKLGSTDVSAAYIGSTLVYSGGTPPTPSSPKWIATYSDSSTSSAACDSTSAITENEITKTNLISVEIGDCVTSIDITAFNYYSSLISCTIGSGVTSIGDGAFYRCYSLSSIEIPSGVTSIGFGAFNQCTGLTSITVEATTPPTLGGTAFDNTNDCPILVPSGSLSAYQSAWSTYSSRIRPIPTWTSVVQFDSLNNLSATAMRVSTAITLSESHNITFGDTSSNTYTLLYENGNWYNWRIMTNGSWTPDSKTLLTAVNGYYTIYFDSTYPCLGADADAGGQGGTMIASFDFEIS